MFNLKKKILCGISSLFMLFTASIPAFAKLPDEWDRAAIAIDKGAVTDSMFSEFSGKLSTLAAKAVNAGDQDYDTFADLARANRLVELMAMALHSPLEARYNFYCLYYNARAAYAKASRIIYIKNEEGEEEGIILEPIGTWEEAKTAIERALSKVNSVQKIIGRSIAQSLGGKLNNLLNNVIAQIVGLVLDDDDDEIEINFFSDLA